MTRPVPTSRSRAAQARRIALFAAVLGPALVGCGGSVFTGAPYAGDIEPQTVPRVTDPAAPGEADDEAAAPQACPGPGAAAPQVAETPPVGPLPRPATERGFPNLADVPPRPDDLPSVEERQRVLEDLQADQARGNAAVGGAGADGGAAGDPAR